MKVRSFFTSQGLQRKCLETTFFLRHYRSSPSTSPNGGSPNHGTAQIMISRVITRVMQMLFIS